MNFIVQGLYEKWKLLLAYFLTRSSVISSTLKFLIKYVIEKCIEQGFNPVALICDKGSNNYSA